ncbi:MAG: Flp pilus assembly complex ATPase component TadA [Clostridia bacterium]|nr:Flp pilus assembly complex ATPase component TadA [Clostridia bacterium]
MNWLQCLPLEIANVVGGLDNLCEIRLRNNSPVRVKCGTRWFWVGTDGLQSTSRGALVVENVHSVVDSACQHSVFAYEDMLSAGFFTFDDGARLGVCGQATVGKDGKLFFKSISSLCLRIPHVANCIDNKTMDKLLQHNVLVVGAPGSGKTTFLRTLASKLAESFNVLVVDQRGELDLGNLCHCDVLKWTSKHYAMDVGVRSLCPDYVVFDELLQEEHQVVEVCLQSGVFVVASIHGKSAKDVTRLACHKLFDRFVVLQQNFGYQVLDGCGNIL